MILGFGGISGSEILVIFLVVLLLFGAKKIPEIARALGKAAHEFRKAKDDLVKSSEDLIDAAEKKAAEEDRGRGNDGE